MGHRFGVTINVSDKYDESIYDNDNFSLHWTFEYFKVQQTASFASGTEIQYQENLPKLMTDIKNIIPRLNQMNSTEWSTMVEMDKKRGQQTIFLI